MVKDQYGLVSAVKANEIILTSLQNKIDSAGDKLAELNAKIAVVTESLEGHKESNTDFHKSLMEVYKDLVEKYEHHSELLQDYNLQLKEHMSRTEAVEVNLEMLKTIVARCEDTISKNSKAFSKLTTSGWVIGSSALVGFVTVAVVDPDSFPRITRLVQLIISLL